MERRKVTKKKMQSAAPKTLEGMVRRIIVLQEVMSHDLEIILKRLIKMSLPR